MAATTLAVISNISVFTQAIKEEMEEEDDEEEAASGYGEPPAECECFIRTLRTPASLRHSSHIYKLVINL